MSDNIASAMTEWDKRSDSQLDLDLTSCDREPIHLIGAVQPHSCLLACSIATWNVVQASANAAEYLVVPLTELLGSSLLDRLSAHDKERLKQRLACAEQSVELQPLRLTFSLGQRSQDFTVQLHQVVPGSLAILELEASEQDPLLTFADFYDRFIPAIFNLQGVATLESLAARVVHEVREITKFDRVWIHRVVDGGHLEVIAELKRPDQQPFLGMKFPASDIPKQARRLFALNRLRLIPDVHAMASPLVPEINPMTGMPLDLSRCVARAVSPVHLQYLRNMQVQASMSISLVKGGELWGLISCHHDRPNQVGYQQRAACELLGRVASMQIPLLEAKVHSEEERCLRVHLEQLESFLTGVPSNGLVAASKQKPEHLLALVNADGVAVCFNDEPPLMIGKTPPAGVLGEVADFVRAQGSERVYATDHLSKVLPTMKAWTAVASGLLAVSLSPRHRFVVMWLRGEQSQIIRWGGNPHQPVVRSPDGGKLSPRASFAQWNELVEGKSRPWHLAEQQMATEFHAAAMVSHRAEELAKLNGRLELSNQELDAFAYVAAHDLKEPLRGIHTYASFLIEDYAATLDSEGKSKLERLMTMTQRMDALINALLKYAQIGRAHLELEAVDLNDLVQEVCDSLHSSIVQSGAKIRVAGKLPVVVADRLRLTEVFQNLLSNAMKYNDRPEKAIEIGQYTNHIADGAFESVIYIRDDGIGIDPKYWELIFQPFKRLHPQNRYGGGSGAGLVIVKKIIERHGGRIWFESTPGEGATFYFTVKAKALGTSL